jgi:hypothetical protein
MAALVEAGTPAELFPKSSTFVGVRRAALSVWKAPMASTSASVGLWAAWLQERQLNAPSFENARLTDWIYLPAKWPESPDDELLPLALCRELGTIAEGACVMVNKAMVLMVQNIYQGGGVGQSNSGALVMDLSFKLNASGFGLAGMAVPAKHLEKGVWRTECVLLGRRLSARNSVCDVCFYFLD